ncbi:uracil-DNA glycosylase [Rhizobium laguerreae]|uniref:Uracil-DNA glycosylase n=1 Tax=Rhizobium laguerreae TaxID=1076926 RepID=A0ABR6G1E9_9HYPH|nr:uracil-DNA glycosylase [Rhizobium laguerreae]MBB3160099.1 uracil-DNA glycosylase [Rhizobium laguerreae]OOO48186.1 hypothetical protein BS630_18335 [Rhizobium laguerreae]
MSEFRDDSEFFNSLFELELDNVFNPYKHICGFHDVENSPYVRRQNIQLFFESARSAKVSTLWIGRDLGYRGGRRTGLPLTDEGNLNRLARVMNESRFRQATRGAIWPERTARVVWDMLAEINQPVFLWNVFPYHPHGPNSEMENRSHTSRERFITAGFLKYVLDTLKPDTIVSIGRDAHTAVNSIGYNCIPVRHPSYGGQTDFIGAIAKIYNLRLLAKKATQLDLF